MTEGRHNAESSRSEGVTRQELTLLVMIFLLSVGEGGARFLSPVYLSDNGAAVGSIGLSLSVFGAAALGSRLFIGLTFKASTVRATIAVSGLASSAALYVITTTTSITTFTILIGIHGFGWGVLATVLLTLVLRNKGTRSATAVIGWYVGVEGLGRTGSPVLAGIVGGAFGPATGMRIHTTIFAVTALAGVLALRNGPVPPSEASDDRSRRLDIRRFRYVPLAAWGAFLTGFYLNTTNAVLNTFFPLLGLSLGFSLGQVGLLAGSRSAVSAVIRFFVDRILKIVSYRILFIPLYLLTAITTGLIGTVTIYPAQFLLWVPNGASRGLLRVGSMGQAMQHSDDDQASATAALIGAGYDIGRIVGPAVGGAVATALGLSTMFVVMPIFFVALILPIAVRTRPQRTSTV